MKQLDTKDMAKLADKAVDAETNDEVVALVKANVAAD